MTQTNRRVLLYSHDTFGFGNIRRNSALARHLVDRYPDTQVLMITGSRWIHLLPAHPRLEYVKLPEIVRTERFRYRSRNESVSLKDLIRLRREIIYGAAKGFRPDLFLVDKSPRGVHEELDPTLERLTSRECSIRLILRDILDEPESTRASWMASKQYEALDRFYDQVWVLGDRAVFPTGDAYGLEAHGPDVRYCGYLMPKLSEQVTDSLDRNLVTIGGGEDGSWILEALAGSEQDGWEIPPTDVVFGPFMGRKDRKDFTRRFGTRDQVRCFGFVPDLAERIRDARSVVSMAGYNSVCEILGSTTPSLVIPRTKPSREQSMRAESMGALGFFRTAGEEEDLQGAVCDFLNAPHQPRFPRPDQSGLESVARFARA